MQIGKGKFILCIAGAFLAGAILAGAFAFNTFGGAGQAVSMDKKLQEIDNNIAKSFYTEHDAQKLKDGAYKGYVEGLGDPYSCYMTKEEFDSWSTSIAEQYSGIGVTFAAETNGEYVIVSIYEDSPAEKAGLKTGDVIVSVDGEYYDEIEIMAARIRGDKGTKVKLGYARDGKTEEVELTRDDIVQVTVKYEMLENNVGYIQISQFLEGTADDFKDALKAVTDKGAKTLILDLRDNGGGLVKESVEIADQFLDQGPICYVVDKNGKKQSYNAEDGKTALKTVALVNENSASSSELLAAALQDNGIKLVGDKTFGKGIIQQTKTLEDGSALKLTILQYLSPKGNQINQKGITPDFAVEENEKTEQDEQMDKALELLGM